VHPMVDGLSVEQKHGLDVPPFGHRWAVNIHTYIPLPGLFIGGIRRDGRRGRLTSTGGMELLVCKDIESPSPPLAWFWARALNLASILEVMMVVALAMLHPLPPSELAALVLVASEATTDSNRKIIIDYLGVNPGGNLGAAGLLVDPSLPGVASCQVPAPLCGVSYSGCPFRGAKARTGQYPLLDTGGQSFILILIPYAKRVT